MPAQQAKCSTKPLAVDWIGNTPMGQRGLTWEDRTRLLRAITDRDDTIPVLALEAIEAAWGMPSVWNVEFLERLERQRIHARGWMRAGTLGDDAPLPSRVEDSLGHLAAGRIAGANE